MMMASKNVYEISDARDWQSHVIEASKEHPVIVDFTASWCGPCKLIAPTFDSVADKYGAHPVNFVKFDIDKSNEDA